MVERLTSRTVLGQDEVADVHQQTPWERFIETLPALLRPLVAIVIVLFGFSVAVKILFTDQQSLMEYRTGAWALISGVVGSALTYFFGDFLRPQA